MPASFSVPSGDVSCLIAAINQANQISDEDTINLAAGTYTLTSIDNSSDPGGSRNGLSQIASAMVINGENAETTIIERDPDGPGFRIFDVVASGRLILNGVTVRGGIALRGCGINNNGTLTITDSIVERNRTGSATGCGIANQGELTLLRSIIRENSAGSFQGGGGIFNSGTASIISSTITDNFYQGGPGGIANGGFEAAFGAMTIHNSTISNNASDSIAGIFNLGVMIITNSTIANNRIINPFFLILPGGISNSGVLHIGNSTISGNRREVGRFPETQIIPSNVSNSRISGILGLQNTIVEECSDSGPLTSLGNNIIGDLTNCDLNLLSSDLTGDPGLANFVNGGMPGRGHFPLNPDSPAIDAGNSDVRPPTDQLGFFRVGICDIGRSSSREISNL